ncbi:ABC transporter permease [uncultured Castellaniella sp.]|jgi:osmoprotectant transport system permease protein|uniref:ABC transporter permease n=1 Tax=uncultured Castellaniella sp. TaxID=647907 RepID=UPI00262A819B|nr:ABC transporter permease [uncultured Castellaniella sp.]
MSRASRALWQTGHRTERLLVLALLALVGIQLQMSGLADDILSHGDDILYLSRQHIELTLISGGLAIATGLPLGIVLSRRFMRRWAEGVMQLLNIGTTIPTLAVLALSMTLLGIGTAPAIFALWIASLLYIVRNTYSGLTAIPQHLQEAAYGVGMSAWQVLWQVELPNALFVIFAGIRTSLAINVGTVPLAFLVGGGGLGELIFTGIDLNDTGTMLAGAIPTALLAIAVDTLMGMAAHALIPRGVNPLR